MSVILSKARSQKLDTYTTTLAGTQDRLIAARRVHTCSVCWEAVARASGLFALYVWHESVILSGD